MGELHFRCATDEETPAPVGSGIEEGRGVERGLERPAAGGLPEHQLDVADPCAMRLVVDQDALLTLL
jgi:hypothetical protein